MAKVILGHMRQRFLVLLLVLSACESKTPPQETPELVKPTAPASQPASAPASLPASLPAKVEVAPGRKLVWFEGKVLVDGKPAVQDAEISETALVETKPKSSAVIKLSNGSHIELREKSKVKFGSNERKTYSLQLMVGRLWALLEPKTSLEVNTQNAVAGVRGTSFFVDAAVPKQTHICACDGEVELSAQGGLPRVVTSKMEHKTLVVKGADKKAKLEDEKKWPKASKHTHEQLEAIIAR